MAIVIMVSRHTCIVISVLILYFACTTSFRTIHSVREIASCSKIVFSSNKFNVITRNTHIDSKKRLYTRFHSQQVNAENADNDSNSDKGSDLLSQITKYKVPIIALIVGVIAVATSASVTGNLPLKGINFELLLNDAVSKISSLGPYGYLYFAALYIAAEILAIPAMPLTASGGYLFGLIPGTLTILLSATIAASFSFFIGRTFLRTWAQKFIAGSPKWRAVDRAIAKEGFKVILLLRLSPLLPFAISNYIYGVTSVDFGSFLAATFIGFTPGTFGIVYAGSVGKALFTEGGLGLPWYAYAGGGALIIYFAQTIAKIASETIKEIEDEDAAAEAAAAAALSSSTTTTNDSNISK